MQRAPTGENRVSDVRVHFDDLPPPVRRRFVACIDGRAEPRPIVASTVENRTAAYAILALVLGTVLLGLAWFGWGIDPDAERLEHGAWITAKYALCIVPFAAAGFAALRARARSRMVPWVAGRYLFPASFIDATSSELRVLPVTGLRAARQLRRCSRAARIGSVIELRFDGGAVETLSLTAGDAPLDARAVGRLRKRLELALSRGNQARALLDPLALTEEDVEIVGGYRAAVKRVRGSSDGPRSRPMPRSLQHPLLAIGCASIALTAALGVGVLPWLAVAGARASHAPGALSRVAHAWPFGWVQRATGVRVSSVDEIVRDFEHRLRDPDGHIAAAIVPWLRAADRDGDPRVPTYVQIVPDRPAALSAVKVTTEQARGIGVSFQRALGLPAELFTIDTRGPLPATPEARHAVFRCSIQASPKAYAAASFSYPAFVLACEAWLVSGASSERMVTVSVEPSPSLDLAKIVDEGDAGPDVMSSAGVEATVYAAMMDSAIAELAAAFERALRG